MSVLVRQLSQTLCSANLTYGGSPSGESVWVAHGCRGSFACATGRLTCGHVFDYLHHRWCACSLPALDALQSELSPAVEPALRRWNDDLEDQVKKVIARDRHRRCMSRKCTAALQTGAGLTVEAWGGLQAQWLLAQSDLGIEQQDAVSVALSLASMVDSTTPRPKAGHVTCESHFQGRQLIYVQVYKSNTIGTCGNLERLAHLGEKLPSCSPLLRIGARHTGQVAFHAVPSARSGSDEPFVFSIVRHPLHHFISGYAEVSLRSVGHAGTPQDAAQYVAAAEERAWYSFTKQPVGSEARARAFIRDMARGRLRAWLPVRESMDIHAFPQVSFLAPFARLDFVSEMENMSAAWATVGNMVAGPHCAAWPPYDSSIRWQSRADHTTTNRFSSSADRETMSRLITPDCSTAESLAVHRMLLPDFVCLGYALSDVCAARLGDHQVKCPLSLPKVAGIP